MCNQGFPSRRGLAAHKWAKHRVKTEIRKHIGDISQCSVCGVDFHSRERLIKHLSERRIRSKHRNATCNDIFLDLSPPLVPESLLLQLETRDGQFRRSARRSEHRHVIAHILSVGSKQSILEGKTKCQRGAEVSVQESRIRKRLYRKTTPEPQDAKAQPAFKRMRLNEKTKPSSTVYKSGC